MVHRLLLVGGLLCGFGSAALANPEELPGSGSQSRNSPQALLAQGRVDEAITSLNTSLGTSPNNAETYYLLCRAQFDFPDWDAAIQACQKAVAIQPNSALYHLWLGRAYGEKADAANFLIAAPLAGKRRTEFEIAVSLDPANVAARTDLAEFYLEAPGIVGGSRQKAEDQAKILESQEAGRAHWVRGRLAQKNNDLATAEKEYKAAVEASHGAALEWLDLALFYRHRQKLDAMEDALRHAAEASSKQPEILMESAETLIRADRELPLAAQWLQRYLDGPMVELAPAFKAHYWLGVALEKQHDKAGAAEQYHKALALARGYSKARDALQHSQR